MNILFFLGTLLLLPCYFTQETEKSIVLDTNNTLLLRGEITEKLATEFIYDVNKRSKKKDLYVFLDTNGGSVDAGNKIVFEIQKYGLSCIAHKALSMGFVILQACKERYVTPLATLMQHQISYGVANEKAKIESYVEYIKQIGDHLTKMQAKKIGISKKDFERRTYNDWWLFGEKIIEENCADEIASVSCTTKLTNQTYNVDKGQYIYTYTKCPLISGHVEKKKNKDYTNQDFFYFI